MKPRYDINSYLGHNLNFVNMDDNNWLLKFNADSKLIVFDWICDETFWLAPTIMYHLYSIHVNIMDGWFPLVFALMKDKTEETYNELFNVLLVEAQQLVVILFPIYTSTDYETAAINAIRHIFPNCQTAGCLFHWGQALQSSGISAAFMEEENAELMILFHSIISLAFIPDDNNVQDVIQALDMNKQSSNDVLAPIFLQMEEN